MPINVPFRYSPLERVHSSDPMLAKKLAKGEPLVVTDCELSNALANKWTVQYLARHMATDFPCNVFHSSDNIFQYWDAVKNQGRYKFTPPTSKSEMSFQDFVAAIRAASDAHASEQPERGDEEADAETKQDGERTETRGEQRADNTGAQRHYLQQSLVVGVGDQILEDFKQVGWRRLGELQKECGFGELTTNLLLVGQGGNVTPLHFDEQQNFFCQLHGSKHIFLFPPKHWSALYPYPVHHACDRQSQLPVCRRSWAIDQLAASGGQPWSSPEFPNAKDAAALHVCLRPGEMVYIPSYWWHHIVGVGESVSLTFWFKCGPTGKVSFPLNATQLVALRRNVEGLMAELVEPAEIKKLMAALLGGTLDSHQVVAVGELEKMLRCVMAPEQTRPFLLDMAAGRFSIPTH